jgi:hypothetical protein
MLFHHVARLESQHMALQEFVPFFARFAFENDELSGG